MKKTLLVAILVVQAGLTLFSVDRFAGRRVAFCVDVLLVRTQFHGAPYYVGVSYQGYVDHLGWINVIGGFADRHLGYMIVQDRGLLTGMSYGRVLYQNSECGGGPALPRPDGGQS